MLILLGRILYAVPMIIIGLFHFFPGAPSQMAKMVPIPGGIFWVYLTGVALITAGISIIWGKPRKLGKLAAILLGVMLLIFAVLVHLFTFIKGGEQAQLSMGMFLKDLSLAGGAFLAAYIFASKK